MFSYTVVKVEPHQITVEYPDKSWAEVPLYEGESKEQIEIRIAEFYHPITEGFKSDKEVPFEVGKEYNVGEVTHNPLKKNGSEPTPLEETRVFGYKDMRRQYYPSTEDQLLAMHYARIGVPDHIEKLDKKIEQINLQFPADMEPISKVEYDELIKHASSL